MRRRWHARPGQVSRHGASSTRSSGPSTRRPASAFSTWLDQQGRAVARDGEDDQRRARQPHAVRRERRRHAGDARRARAAPRDGWCATRATVFEALSERQGQLRGLISNSNRVFQATAARDAELADTFLVLPHLPARDAHHHPPADRSSPNDTDPLVTQLRPAARAALADARWSSKGLAPDLKGVFQRPRSADQGVQARACPRSSARSTTPSRCSRGSTPSCATSSRSSTTWASTSARSRAFFANDAAATKATDRRPSRPRPLHYLRTTNPLNPEILAAYPTRHRHQPLQPLLEPAATSKLRSRGPSGVRQLPLPTTPAPVPAARPPSEPAPSRLLGLDPGRSSTAAAREPRRGPALRAAGAARARGSGPGRHLPAARGRSRRSAP